MRLTAMTGGTSSSTLAELYRIPFLIDATGESLSSERASASFELVRHGFAAWGGITEESLLQSGEGHRPLPDLLHSDVYDNLGIIACRDPAVLRSVLDGNLCTGVVFIGTPQTHRQSGSDSPLNWPLVLPNNVDPSAVTWLGAPSWVNLAVDIGDKRRAVARKALSASTVVHYLHKIEEVCLSRAVARVCVVLNIDDLSSLAPHGRVGVKDEIYSAALNWAQRALPFEATALIYSEGVLPAAKAKLMGDVARNLGKSLFRAVNEPPPPKLRVRLRR